MKPLCSILRVLRYAAALAALALAAAPLAIRADDWPFVRRDKLSDGVAESTVSDAVDVLWTYKVDEDSGFEATAIVVDGVVYVGDVAGTFHAVRLANGEAVWKKSFEDSSFMAGAAFDDGKLFVGDGNGNVRCLFADDGSEIWSATVDAEVYAGPMVLDGRVLVTCEAGMFASFDSATGEKQWQFQIDAPLRCTPTTVNGHTLLAGCDSKLHLIDVTTGKQSTTIDIDAPTGATAGVRASRAYFGTEGGTFYAIDLPTTPEELPSVAWTYRDESRGQPIRAAAAITDKLVVYGSQGKAVYALDRASGELKWKLPTRTRVDSSPVIAGDRVVAATDRGVLYIINAETGEPTWRFDAGGSFSASPVVVDSRIILGNGDGTLYCFGAAKKAEGFTTESTEDTEKH
jgi:outer membrane protein assembly factor BamB